MIGLSIAPTLLLSLLGALLGLAIGSFLNVVVWRVPRGASIVSPGSACPSCDHPIRARDNVPVASWLGLRGRCRDCSAEISPRYPLVELGTGLAFTAVTLYLGFSADRLGELPALLFLAGLSIALALIDIDTHTLPNSIVLPSYPIAATLLVGATLAHSDWSALGGAVIGAAGMFAMYLILAALYPEGMGLGDVKLAGLLGLFLGWLGFSELLVGAFAAFVLGGAYAGWLLISGRARIGSGIPFAPWMLAGCWVGIFAGEPIAHVYLVFVGLE